MAKAKTVPSSGSSEISVKYWIFAIIISVLPLVNLILLPLFAIFSRNPSKKNFYKANILLILIPLVIAIVVVVVVYGVEVFDQLWFMAQEFVELNQQEALPVEGE